MLKSNNIPSFVPANRLELLARARRLITREMADWLIGLTDKQMEAALFIYQLEMTEQEAAKVLGCSRPVITKRLLAVHAKAKKNILGMKGTKKRGASVYTM